MLDLKDAFFCIPLREEAQTLFAFEWTPLGEQAWQLTWTVLSWGFRDSPHLFGKALSRELRYLALPQGTISQYVDEILICSHKRGLEL